MASLLRAGSLRYAAPRSILGSRSRLLSTVGLLPRDSLHLRMSRPLSFQGPSRRWNSTTPNPPLDATSSVDAISEALGDAVSTIPPLQAGDFAALGLHSWWWPPGVIQYSIETIHLATGLPWFWTLIATTVFWRAVIFPTSILGARTAAKTKEIQPLMTPILAEVTAARQAGDMLRMQKASMEAANLRRKHGVTIGKSLVPLLQLPVQLGLFFGVKQICSLPVIQLTQSGFALLPDLTVAPPLVLPVAVAALSNVLITVNSRETDLSNPTIAHIMNIFRVLTLASIFVFINLPAGVSVSILSTTVLTCGQMFFLRTRFARTLFKLPPLGPPSRLPTLRETFYYYTNQATPTGGASKSRSTLVSDVRPYVPPKAPALPKMPSPPPPPAAQQRPTTLEALAQQAQASAKSNLFEEAPTPAKPAVTPAPAASPPRRTRGRPKKATTT
ncbi:Inner membrane protein [Mycena kentingensis (nom. inval.)]|nr:Inner membrane protein [Mycena kentingensis (nom. inval.)]